MDKFGKILGLSAALLTTALFADQNESAIPIRDLKQIVAKESKQLPKKIKTKLFFESSIPPLCFPEDYQLLRDVYPLKNSTEDIMGNITLEDGSNWKVRSSHVYRLTKWQPGHRIVITQNNSLFFTKFPFRLINYTLKESIDVKAYQGPDSRGVRINYIQAIDYDRGEIIFHNGRRGILCSSNYSTYKSWKNGDVISTGINTEWGSDYNHILINMSSKEQVENGKVVLSNLVMY